jgi:hypothetical protein
MNTLRNITTIGVSNNCIKAVPSCLFVVLVVNAGNIAAFTYNP